MSFPAELLATAADVERLKSIGFSMGEITRIVAPRRTLERRRSQAGRLTLAESDRVRRLERVMTHAERVFGSAEKAQRWLRKPSRALDGAVPLDLLESETGAHLVEQELHAIDFGMFA